jgi:hypothetical protein
VRPWGRELSSSPPPRKQVFEPRILADSSQVSPETPLPILRETSYWLDGAVTYSLVKLKVHNCVPMVSVKTQALLHPRLLIDPQPMTTLVDELCGASLAEACLPTASDKGTVAKLCRTGQANHSNFSSAKTEREYNLSLRAKSDYDLPKSRTWSSLIRILHRHLWRARHLQYSFSAETAPFVLPTSIIAERVLLLMTKIQAKKQHSRMEEEFKTGILWCLANRSVLLEMVDSVRCSPSS